MNRELFKTEILKSPFLELAKEKLKINDEIIVVLLAGSRGSGLDLPESDIDVAILTKNSWDLEPDIKGEFQGSLIHWWITPFDFSLKAYNKPSFIPVLLTGNYYMNFSEENLIWVNPKYHKLVAFLDRTISDMKPFIIANLVLYYEKNMAVWRAYENFPFAKTYAPLLDFYWETNNLPKNIELLKKAKAQVRHLFKETQLSAEEQTEIRQALLWIADWYEALPYNYKQSMLEWQLEAAKILDDIEKA